MSSIKMLKGKLIENMMFVK